MGKYGKRQAISLDPCDYNLAVFGESGIGKTTLAVNFCRKLCGDDGYILFDIGKEDGARALGMDDGYMPPSVTIPDWDTLTTVVDDIIENKDNPDPEIGYPHLREIIFDTLDELILLAEAESVRQYNKGKPVDKRADSINAAWGGFNKGQDYAAQLILNMMWQIKNIGIGLFIIGHTKRSDIIDPVTQETYSKLTADCPQRYFNQFKNKMHIIGMAYIDRDIVKEKTGRKNVVNHEDITYQKVVGESRIISFRDDTYSVDSKSRFSQIVDKIPLDADAYMKAIKDAIEYEAHGGGDAPTSGKETDAEKGKRETSGSETESSLEQTAENFFGDDTETPPGEIDEVLNKEYLNFILTNQGRIKEDEALADKIKNIKKEYSIPQFSKANVKTVKTEGLKKIVDLLS